jgi:hypothetical protein
VIFLAERDIQYSFDPNEPYYLQTALSGTLGQQIYGPVDAELRVGGARLAYRQRAGAPVPVPDRVDRVRTFGFGGGYRLGDEVRVGFNMDRQRRESGIPGHEYDGWRYGVVATYGL